ncbi:hypothetical protein CN692_13310 [Bacillus sp. AFS002410]|uniref:hypothetical protein n=1 Tax=Bacillus sp. AFS002410 TaxID=2033481 RepID=UPI000BF13DC7|nr:hypothetical protein [Bacillus sp. AFS002410]PEJ57386.1 hypothetical protein CN692_13310 [Bacillus sp. AFS002410]
MKLSKSAILPIISVICLCIATITGHQISSDVQDHIAAVASVTISAVVSIWGIVKNHQKENDAKAVEEEKEE